MIEKIIRDYLDDRLDVPVYMEEQNKEKKYVLIEKTGGGEENYLKKPILAIQSYSDSLYGASELNEKVKDIMKNCIELDEICKCSLNSDYNYTDTKTKKYCYQAVFNIVHY